MFTFVLFFTILGAILGSFLHVVSLRLRTGVSFIKGSSRCLSCGTKLSWYELIPLFSWILQKGRCRHCSSPIPKEVFFAELLTSFLFFFISGRYLFIEKIRQNFSFQSYFLVTLLFLFLSSVFIIIFFYDLRHKIIPDELFYIALFVSLFAFFFFSFDKYGVYQYVGFHFSFLDFLRIFLIPLFFFFIWFFSKGKYIGFGDIKFMVLISLLFPFSYALSTIFLSFWIATFVVFFAFFLRLDYFAARKRKSIMKEEIPFAPFLILATWITTVTGFNVFC